MAIIFFLKVGFYFKVFFADSADGAYPVIGNIFESCAGSHSVVGVANCGIIDPVANCASVFFHNR